jgi:aryl-alcohol dehydrogenase-like predicted oxidoreductase
MQYRMLGRSGLNVSALTLGGGGIGMVWGPTTDEECIETVKQAVASGINLIDVAPVYGRGKAEEIVGQAWPELNPKPLVATKVFIIPNERDDLAGAVRRSLEMSLGRMGLNRVDIFQLHNQVELNDPVSPRRLTLHEVVGPRGVLDAMQKLKEEGLAGAIGFTGIARHDAVRQLFSDSRLATVQLVTNLLCSEGEMGVPEDIQCRDHLEMVRLAAASGLGVFGIRPYADCRSRSELAQRASGGEGLCVSPPGTGVSNLRDG